MKDLYKKVIAVGAGVILVGAGFIGGFATHQPREVTIVEEKLVEVPFEVQVPVIEEVEVVKEVEVEKIVEVEDEELLKLVCDRLMFEDLQECRAEVKAEDEALNKALSIVKDEKGLIEFFADEKVVRRETKASLLRVYDDFEDVEIIKSDFDWNDYEFKIKVRVEDELKDDKFYANVIVKVDDGETEFVSIEKL